jgi:hypothetical protein
MTARVPNELRQAGERHEHDLSQWKGSKLFITNMMRPVDKLKDLWRNQRIVVHHSKDWPTI